MRLILLTTLAMCAFAANSVLNRMAVADGEMDPMTFALIRLVAGAVVLGLLVALRRGAFWPGWNGRVPGVGGLLVYLAGFSLAYKGLDAGTGALILFGCVQVTMFAGALAAGDAVPAQRWAGAGLAFGGLVVLLAPVGVGVSVVHGALMAVAGAGWGIYSLAGRGVRDPLAATAANFVLAVPVAMLALPWVPLQAQAAGIGLAIASGAVTSGLGYALWYALVPQLGAARAAVAQLTVPVIAAAAGLVLLAEPVGWRFAIAAVMVMAGVLLASRSKPRYGTITSSGS
ncbi:MAG: DMT family transporter [Paracoccaceae bacterium]